MSGNPTGKQQNSAAGAAPETLLEPAPWGASFAGSLFSKGQPGRRALSFPAWDGEAVETDLPPTCLRHTPAELPSLSCSFRRGLYLMVQLPRGYIPRSIW